MKVSTLILIALVFVSFNCVTLGAEKGTLPPEPDYIEIIKDRYKDLETSEKLLESWKTGMLTEYKLFLDHVQIQYEHTTILKTTDDKTLVCGNMLIIAYGKTLDGQKKRVLSLRSLCHLFSKGKLERITIINREDNKLLNGWDDLIII